ncbi:hypothetical protein Tco_0317414 [Tanacetum coccineum]
MLAVLVDPPKGTLVPRVQLATATDEEVAKRRGPTAKGAGLCVADSHTGNHLEGGFTPLETNQRLLVVIGRTSYSGFEGETFELEGRDTIAVQRCGLSAKELNEFLSSYPIPSKYDVILPTSTQTIFDTPPGFFNLCRAGSWLTFQKRSKKHILNFLPKVITRIKGWHERFFFGKDSIISSKYPQLLLDENKLDLKSFKDKIPPNLDENPYFQCLGRYPISVRVFDDLILFLVGLQPSWEFGQPKIDSQNSTYIKYIKCKSQPNALNQGKRSKSRFAEMAFRNFIYTEDDDDLAFLPKEPSPGFGIGSPSASVNTKLPKDVEEPEVQPAEITADSGESPKAGVFVVHPRSVAARIKERKCKMRGGSSRPPVKRKLASGSSSSRAVRAKTSASKDDAPILSISDDDEGLSDCFKLKDANVCHLKISIITPLAWKGHLDNQMDLELLDLHDRCYALWERSREEECEELRVKCEAAMKEFDQNPAILALREKISSLTVDVKEHKEAEKARLEAIEASLRREVEELKQDRRDVVSKVVPYATMEFVHSDELGRLVGKLVSSAITYGRCRAYEQVAAIKEPFDLSKAKGYHSSYQKEHTQASNDFATATFPWLDEFVADATALIEALLSKKPPMLQKPAPSRT